MEFNVSFIVIAMVSLEIEFIKGFGAVTVGGLRARIVVDFSFVEVTVMEVFKVLEFADVVGMEVVSGVLIVAVVDFIIVVVVFLTISVMVI